MRSVNHLNSTGSRSFLYLKEVDNNADIVMYLALD